MIFSSDNFPTHNDCQRSKLPTLIGLNRMNSVSLLAKYSCMERCSGARCVRILFCASFTATAISSGVAHGWDFSCSNGVNAVAWKRWIEKKIRLLGMISCPDINTVEVYLKCCYPTSGRYWTFDDIIKRKKYLLSSVCELEIRKHIDILVSSNVVNFRYTSTTAKY